MRRLVTRKRDLRVRQGKTRLGASERTGRTPDDVICAPPKQPERLRPLEFTVILQHRQLARSLFVLSSSFWSISLIRKFVTVLSS